MVGSTGQVFTLHNFKTSSKMAILRESSMTVFLANVDSMKSMLKRASKVKIVVVVVCRAAKFSRGAISTLSEKSGTISASKSLLLWPRASFLSYDHKEAISSGRKKFFVEEI